MPHLINSDDHGLTTVQLRFGEIQLVARAEGVLIDLQSHGYDTMERAYRQNARSVMSVEETLALRDALTRMLATRLPRQAAA
jgi:hypothetical protein